jgi:hypothetical protein
MGRLRAITANRPFKATNIERLDGNISAPRTNTTPHVLITMVEKRA